ncbi:MAG: glycosyltransferase [Flavobacteriales bacterium]|nr:glycosyltransferase [Flavobacteriales bacterium]
MSNRIKRLTEWWRPKAGVLLSISLFYLTIWEIPFVYGGAILFYSVITLVGFGVVGYLLNDWADVDDDMKVGKVNLLVNLPIFTRIFLFTIAFVLTSLPWFFYFEADLFSWLLIVLQLSLMAIYPLRPFRLKRFPKVAIVIDSLYAFMVPAILAWHTFDITLCVNSTEQAHFILLGTWMLFTGLRQILNHHVVDKANDKRTKTPNLALIYSPITIRTIIESVLFPIELIAAIGFFVAVGSFSGYFSLVMALVAGFSGYLMRFGQGIGFRVGFNRTSFDRFSSFWLGFICSVMLVVSEIEYSIVATAFLFLFSDIFFHPILRVIIKRINDITVRAVMLPYRLASLSFNWTLYYFRKWILQWSEERNWGKHYDKHLADVELESRRRKGTVAVFNQNYDKYTETFVRGHISHLAYEVISFHGWPSPIHVNKMENLVSDEAFLQKANYRVWDLLDIDVSQQENSLIAKRLMNENVNVILAEFGTMGNRLVPISKMTGIPMVCIFYGYDAWNRDVLNEVDYCDLFESAEKLIGVSNDICEKLKDLGCPVEKIQYLPCYVDLNLFTPVKRDYEKLNLLAVGRFSSTKAPHLTILAFNEVIKCIPDATLTMVGGDEDGESYEFCVSLIRSLQLEQKVRLKGKLSAKEVMLCMQEATIFVQHSITTPIRGDKEGTPVAVMEAMASGLPVVATRHAGIAEIIEHGQTGILVDEFDFRSMAKEVVALFLAKDKMILISSAAIESVRNNRLVFGHVDYLEKLLTEVIKDK